jgi:hypothetical protein
MNSLRYVLEVTNRSAQDPEAQTSDGLQSAREERPLSGSQIQENSTHPLGSRR